MIDLHCHILPGLDDGPSALAEALAMARFCAADGITHVAATPHCNRSTHLLRDDIVPEVARFNEALAAEGIALTVLPGSEIQLTDAEDYRREFEAGVLCHLGDGGEFTLLEFNWHAEAYHADAPGLVRWLRDRGMTPIIAHPERHGFFRDDPPRLTALVDMGAWLQVTVDSLLGRHGREAAPAAMQLLRDFEPVVLSTDAHNLRRCSGLAAGYAWVAEWLGPRRAGELLARGNMVRDALVGCRKAV